MSPTIRKLLLLVILLAGITLALSYRDQFNAEILEQWLADSGAAAPIVFMCLYAIATVFFLPGSLLTLLGGALFGPYWGTFYNLTGATIGAMLSFLVARYLASDWVTQKAAGRMKQLINGVEQEGWRFVAFTRLVPLFPFNLLNYALGLTRISFSHYSLATYICMLPGAIAYTYLGYAGKEAIAGGENMIQKILLAIALLAAVGFLPRIIARFRRGPMMAIPELHQRLDQGEDILLLDVRTAEDFVGEQGHVHNARLIPVEELTQRMDEIRDYQDKLVVTICRTDRKSATAAQLLARNGFSNVQVARMGMTDWIKNGYPVE